jgi:hypothetical protein
LTTASHDETDRRAGEDRRAWDHPSHYGGKDNPHEAIKCITAHDLGFALGNAVKYIFRAGHKVNHTLGQGADHAKLEDLQKARWYIEHEIQELEKAAHGEAMQEAPESKPAHGPF